MPNKDIQLSKVALDGVLSRFSNRTETINSYYDKSPTFREICEDYAEMVKWIEDYCESGKETSSNCAYAEETVKELEAEIIECLDGKNKLVYNECGRSIEK